MTFVRFYKGDRNELTDSNQLVMTNRVLHRFRNCTCKYGNPIHRRRTRAPLDGMKRCSFHRAFRMIAVSSIYEKKRIKRSELDRPEDSVLIRIPVKDLDFFSVGDQQRRLTVTRNINAIRWRGEINRRDTLSRIDIEDPAKQRWMSRKETEATDFVVLSSEAVQIRFPSIKIAFFTAPEWPEKIFTGARGKQTWALGSTNDQTNPREKWYRRF